ncbi:MAG: hypothetical protein AAGG51_05230 [Cyanobacteria bacterium P01_G01_bin.54]
MSQPSDEDKLIHSLQDHRDLKYWVMKQLRAQGLTCQETYGNDANGDIQLLDGADVTNVQAWALSQHQLFNPRESNVQLKSSRMSQNPHLEIKTSYLCGKEAEWIVMKETIIAVVSASKISRPSQKRLIEAGIIFIANVPRSEFH